MSLEGRVIQLQDLDEIIQFESLKLKEQVADEMEQEFAKWSARWRKESLEHYLPLGWSFLVRDQQRLVGYFLAQPFLFLEGMTQTLWVEHISYSSLEARDFLCELAYKMSREKHFQKAIFPDLPGIQNAITPLKPERWLPSMIIVKTAKL